MATVYSESSGDKYTISAAAAVVKGEPVALGSLVGIAMNSAAAGEDVVIQLTGVVVGAIGASTQTWVAGAHVWANISAGELEDGTASGNQIIGNYLGSVNGGDTVDFILRPANVTV